MATRDFLPQRAIEAYIQAQNQSQDLLVRAVVQYALESPRFHLSETTQQCPPFKEFFMNRLLLLKQVALFSNLSLDELVLIDEALEQEEFLAGETIFTEGSIGSHFYIIGDGNVRITKAIDGVQKELSRLAAPQYFGEMALFDDSPRSASAIAQSDCTLLKLEKSRFISLIAQRPQIVLEICKFLSDRVRATDIYRVR
ncbi:MAG: cyclic nucleotide-binding domain-containing protein [Coleofasciculaceae cyanobacterium SM2_3_26]|nr:cyclic nucleotide-binding domain-containing protein [Coleofasciculaceae cyanobacterium SM2_3_26]